MLECYGIILACGVKVSAIIADVLNISRYVAV